MVERLEARAAVQMDLDRLEERAEKPHEIEQRQIQNPQVGVTSWW